MDLTTGVTIISVIAGVITIIWFFRDMRRENSKLLKEIIEIQKQGLETLNKGLENIAQITSKGLENIAQITKESQQIAKESLQILKDHTVIFNEILKNISREDKK